MELTSFLSPPTSIRQDEMAIWNHITGDQRDVVRNTI